MGKTVQDPPPGTVHHDVLTFPTDWTVFGEHGVLGGLLLSTVEQAAVRLTGLTVVSLSVRFARAIQPDLETHLRAEVTEAWGRGREVRAILNQGGIPRLKATVSLVPVEETVCT
ncbi:hypothetical protein [Streptomyces mirabilis]|uniref:hypothetical protein n=1 Tax=Streptomyces mirabilis TaxID=68239 RepID=UPI0033B96B34